MEDKVLKKGVRGMEDWKLENGSKVIWSEGDGEKHEGCDFFEPLEKEEDETEC